MSKCLESKSDGVIGLDAALFTKGQVSNLNKVDLRINYDTILAD